MSDETIAAGEAGSTRLPINRKLIIGSLCGIFAAFTWGSSFGLARVGTLAGLTPIDFMVLRILPGACLSLFLIWRRGTGGVTLGKALALSLCIGPSFVSLATGGYLFAPLAHGAVLQPGTMTLTSFVAATLLFRDKLVFQRLVGAIAIVCGLVLVAGSGFSAAGPRSLIGDAMFASAGLLWAIYTAFLRHWRIPAVSGTAFALVISGLLALPFAVAAGSLSHLAQFPPAMIVSQILVQGVLAGFLGIVFYGWSVAYIGAPRATLFAAIVPVIAILIGIPVAGEWPDPAQWAGVIVVTAGLLLGLGVLDSFFAKRAV